MPANLTPEYLKAEQVYKEARTIEDKIAALEEMLRVVPKHKGTDHLQGDLRRRLSKLRDEATKPRSKKGYNPFSVRKQGAGQVLLLGAPNSGKSSLAEATTNAHLQVTDYPFATQKPAPCMMPFEDVQIQVVDLPPITRQYAPPGLLGLVKSTDAVLLIGDLASDRTVEDVDDVLQSLAEGRVHLFDPDLPPRERESLVAYVPTLLVLTKADSPGAEDLIRLSTELHGDRFRPIPICTRDGRGLDALPRHLFRLLDRIRVYSKEPGKPADRSRPFVLRRGETVLDLARSIHRDFPDHLREARLWGSSRFEGQAVHKDHELEDGDIVELHVNL